MTVINVEKLILQANNAADRGNWDKAFEMLSQAADIESSNTGVINGLGVCLLQMGRMKEAVSYFVKLVGFLPESLEAYCSLGMAYAGCGEMALAENVYVKALQLSPNNRTARKGLAIVYLQQSVRFGEGMQILTALVRSDQEDIESVLMLADCYEQGKNNPAAKKLYERALEIQPGNSLAQSGLLRLGG